MVILLFPDGRLTPRRWRWVLWAYAGLAAYFITVVWVPTIAAVARHDVRLDSFGDVTNAGLPSGGAATAAAVLVLVLIGGPGCHSWLTRCSAGGGRQGSVVSS